MNYSRQLAKHCMAMLSTPIFDPEERALLSSVVDLHSISTKFLLPDGGRLYDDLELRAIDESVPLRLPYPYLCLEYHTNGRDRVMDEPFCLINGAPQYEQDGEVMVQKKVVYVREWDGFIVMTIAFWTRHDSMWHVQPDCAIPTTGCLDRGLSFKGMPGIKVILKDKRLPLSDYTDEIGALFCFLNVLQCSNVHVERSEPKKAGKKIKSALPFDTYHILTIPMPGKTGDGAETGGHRSPREHLRRGHIRRLSDGRRIWVNATVVAAGRGAGMVTKNYALRCTA